MGETAPFWRFSADSYPDLEETVAVQPTLKKTDRSLNGSVSDTSRVHTFQMLLMLFASTGYSNSDL